MYTQIDYDHILESNKLDELNGNKLCEFIITDKWTPHTESIIQTWKDHFTAKGCPWALEQCGSIRILWKIDETLSTEEARREREKPNVRWFRESDGAIENQ